METLFNFKNFGIILEKGEESWHGPTIGVALSAPYIYVGRVCTLSFTLG